MTVKKQPKVKLVKVEEVLKEVEELEAVVKKPIEKAVVTPEPISKQFMAKVDVLLQNPNRDGHNSLYRREIQTIVNSIL